MGSIVIAIVAAALGAGASARAASARLAVTAVVVRPAVVPAPTRAGAAAGELVIFTDGAPPAFRVRVPAARTAPLARVDAPPAAGASTPACAGPAPERRRGQPHPEQAGADSPADRSGR